MKRLNISTERLQELYCKRRLSIAAVAEIIGISKTTTYRKIKGLNLPCGGRYKYAIDYHNLAERQGFQWLGASVPKNTKTKTRWLCNRGHCWKATYSNIRRISGCPTCNGHHHIPKTANDYHAIADEHSLSWLGLSVPRDTITKTKWLCAQVTRSRVPCK